MTSNYRAILQWKSVGSIYVVYVYITLIARDMFAFIFYTFISIKLLTFTSSILYIKRTIYIYIFL